MSLLALAGCRADPTAEAPSSANELAVNAASPWNSPEACEAAVLAGKKNARPGSVLRAATWNVRYFPDGADPRSEHKLPTNVRWLACTLAWMDADVFVLQEIQSNERGIAAFAEVIGRLNELTQGRWRADIDDCHRGTNGQHVAFLHDETRVTLADVRHIAWDERADAANACSAGRRSAWTTRVTAPSGRVLRLVGVHAKSAEDASSFGARQGALTQLESIMTDARGDYPDDPVVVAGDFNTMGCKQACGVTALEEIRRLDESAAAARMQHIPSGRSCSYVDDQYTALLDHFLVSDSLAKSTSPSAFVSGICGELGCSLGRGVSTLRAWRELSDHCPALVNIANP